MVCTRSQAARAESAAESAKRPRDESVGDCTCTGRAPGVSGRHRAGCPLSRATSCQARPPHTPSSASNIQSIQLPEVTSSNYFSSFEQPCTVDEIVQLPISVLLRIPPLAVPSVCSAFSFVLKMLSASCPATWWVLVAFPKLVLGNLSHLRGRTKAKAVITNCRLFTSGHWKELLEQALVPHPLRNRDDTGILPVTANSRYDLPNSPETLTDVTIKTIVAQARRGEFGNALRSLSCAKQAPKTAETAEKLQRLHPAGCPVTLPTFSLNPASFEFFIESIVQKAVTSTPRGSSPGPTGLTTDHLRQCIMDASADIVGSLCHACKLVASGQVHESVRHIIFGASLHALEKSNGGVRPVACGDPIRRLTAKVLAQQFKRDIETIVSPYGQVGVATSNGIEALFHCARRFAESARTSDMVLAKLDITNAFNSIDRQAVVDGLGELPSLLPYVCAAANHHHCSTRARQSSRAKECNRGTHWVRPYSCWAFYRP